MKFRPCIDLHDGKVKQIVGSTLDDRNPQQVEVNFEADASPAWYAELYRRDNLTGGHVIMLGPGNDAAAREALAAYPGGMQIGGGINIDNAACWLECGADKVIATSWVFVDGRLHTERLQQLIKKIGRDKLVLDLSCRRRDGKYYIVTDRWQRFTSLEVNRETLAALSSSCAEFLIHAVDVEGMQSGVDRELLEIMAAHCEIPATYAGGIRSFDDIAVIETAGSGRIDFTVGSALDIFGGSLPYRDLASAYAQLPCRAAAEPIVFPVKDDILFPLS
jgi:phosphoribosylformimino-5-aminoimidazole carboxamide ribotide isomerase